MSLISAIKPPLSISNAIKKASQATGADFSYLLKTAARESAFNNGAKAKTSSAAGLFQFIENTWLKTVKEAGNKFGLGKYTPHIFKTRNGRHYVPNQKLRREILQLRHNPEVSAVMAGAFTKKNSEYVASELGRDPTQGELYIAHFLGPKGASDLISLAEKSPNTRADRHFPRAARANKPIFYSRGRPRTAVQVYNELIGGHAKLQTVAATPVSATQKLSAPGPAKSAVAKPVAAPVKQTSLLGEGVTVRLTGAPATQVNDRTGLRATPTVQKTAPRIPGDVMERQAVGLLGQKGSPIAAMTKIASLPKVNSAPAPKNLSDAAPGGIGVWTTSVRLPVDEAVAADTNKNQKDREPAPVERQRAARSRRASRTDRLLEASAKRNARHGAIRTTSAVDSFRSPDFWEQMSMNGS